MGSDAPVAVVQAWQDAANAQDIETLLALSTADIEIIGPRGSGRGHELVRDWLGRAGLNLTTLRAFVRGNVVVLSQHGVWRSAKNEEIVGKADLASRFRVRDGRVDQFARYDTLDLALQDAGLTYSDEVSKA